MGDFASEHMKRMGWREGKGLGALENGLEVPVRVKMKKDQQGVGSLVDETFGSVWCKDLYDKMAGGIQIKVTPKATKSGETSPKITLTTKKGLGMASQTLSKASLYSGFVGGMVEEAGVERGDLEKTGSDDGHAAGVGNKMLTDEDLLKACNGRVGFRGARYSITQSAKLARLAATETPKKKEKKDKEAKKLKEIKKKKKKKKKERVN